MQSLRQYRRLQSRSNTDQYSENDVAKVESRSPFSERNETIRDSTGGSQDSHTLIGWEGPNDPEHPRNWQYSRKVGVAAIVWINIFVLDWCSSSDSQIGSELAAAFHVSKEAETVASAAYVFGVAIGALSAGPISETVGRNPIYLLSRCVHLGFILGTALAPNYASQVVFRFLAGLGASIISAIHGASIADIFGPDGRSTWWPFVALGSFLGTTFAPVVGGWIAESPNVSFRWCDWIAFILSAVTFIINFFWLPETFAPILLKWKAIGVRKATGNDRFMAEIEVQPSFWTRLRRNYKRAVDMTTKEYIVIQLGLWLVVVYIVVYGFLQGFDNLFMDTYGFSRGLTGTSFAAIAVGITLNTLLAPIFARHHRRLSRQWKEKTNENEELPPEYRLIPAFPVAVLFPISLFWLGWTNYPSISPWSGLGAVVLFGFVWAGIYVSIYQYILDVYGIYAGSALATITFARYMFGGGMQIVSKPMWGNLGTHWTCTLLGCLATLLVPVPFIFFHWGPKIRARSKFAGQSILPDGAEKESAEEEQPV